MFYLYIYIWTGERFNYWRFWIHTYS